MGYRVLVVDDSPMIRSLLKDFLGILGHEVVGEADNGTAALQAYAALHPDLTTLDLSLPDMDGLAVLQEIRAKNPAAPAILVTANTQDEVAAQARALGVIALIGKPFEISQIAAAMAKLPGPQAGTSSS
ncbi:MAG TPA: response regulator [Elusimicrobiota bacterium]|jgi:two-component system chemotaxis response regulator CheY|nr:response regulator [Elusimicrobiota bacterium]